MSTHPPGLAEATRMLDWFADAGILGQAELADLRAAAERAADDAREPLIAHPRIGAQRMIEASLELEGADEWICPGYALVDLLGAGGVGVVYRALDLERDTFVALKLLHEHVVDEPTALPRLEREVGVARRLSHPCLPWYGELGTSRAGTPFIVMQLLEATSLHDAMGPQRDPIDERRAWQMLARLADVLAHLGAQGVVHRDIKPRNVLLGSSPSEVYLCDLGLAFAPGRDTSLTEAGEVIGTPHFMSPEHAYGERDLTGAADVYALGATLYYAVTGEPPFDGNRPLDIMRKHDLEPVPPPRIHRPSLSVALDLLLVRMMAKVPAERPTPNELVALAEAELARTPAPTAPTPTPRQPSTVSERAAATPLWAVLLFIAIIAAALSAALLLALR